MPRKTELVCCRCNYYIECEEKFISLNITQEHITELGDEVEIDEEDSLMSLCETCSKNPMVINGLSDLLEDIQVMIEKKFKQGLRLVEPPPTSAEME